MAKILSCSCCHAPLAWPGPGPRPQCGFGARMGVQAGRGGGTMANLITSLQVRHNWSWSAWKLVGPQGR